MDPLGALMDRAGLLSEKDDEEPVDELGLLLQRAGIDPSKTGAERRALPEPPPRTFIENMMDSTTRGWGVFYYDMLSGLAAWGLKDPEEVEAEQDEFIKRVQADPIEAANFVSSAFHGAAEMAPGMTFGWMTGAATGALSSLIPIPGAGRVGFTVGSMAPWYLQGTGATYKELKDEGISDDVAAPIAKVMGLPYAAVEFSQAGRIFPWIKAPAKQIIRRTVGESVKKYLLRQGKEFAKDVTREGLEEVVQEGIIVGSRRAGTWIENEVSGTDLEQHPAVDDLARVLKTFPESIGPMAILLGPKRAVNMLRNLDALPKNPSRKQMAEALGVEENKLPDMNLGTQEERENFRKEAVEELNRAEEAEADAIDRRSEKPLEPVQPTDAEIAEYVKAPINEVTEDANRGIPAATMALQLRRGAIEAGFGENVAVYQKGPDEFVVLPMREITVQERDRLGLTEAQAGEWNAAQRARQDQAEAEAPTTPGMEEPPSRNLTQDVLSVRNPAVAEARPAGPILAAEQAEPKAAEEVKPEAAVTPDEIKADAEALGLSGVVARRHEATVPEVARYVTEHPGVPEDTANRLAYGLQVRADLKQRGVLPKVGKGEENQQAGLLGEMAFRAQERLGIEVPPVQAAQVPQEGQETAPGARVQREVPPVGVEAHPEAVVPETAPTEAVVAPTRPKKGWTKPKVEVGTDLALREWREQMKSAGIRLAEGQSLEDLDMSHRGFYVRKNGRFTWDQALLIAEDLGVDVGDSDQAMIGKLLRGPVNRRVDYVAEQEEAERKRIGNEEFERLYGDAPIPGRENAGRVNENTLDDGTLVYLGGEWYQIDSGGEQGRILEDGETRNVEPSQTIDADAVVPPDHERYREALAEFQKQVKAEKPEPDRDLLGEPLPEETVPPLPTAAQTEIPGEEPVARPDIPGQTIMPGAKERTVEAPKAKQPPTGPEAGAAYIPTGQDIDEARQWWEDYLKARGEKAVNAKPELKWWDEVAKTILYYRERVPTVDRIYRAAERMGLNAPRFVNFVLRSPDGTKLVNVIDQLRRKSKSAYEKFSEYVLQTDIDQSGYRVRQQKTGFSLKGGTARIGPWEILGRPDDAGERKVLATAATEEEAWTQAYAREAAEMQSKGWSQDEVAALLAYRQIEDQSFGILDHMRNQLEAFYKENEMDPPLIPTPKGKRNLITVMREMGDLRGSYFPRLRKQGMYELRAGRYQVAGTKEGKKISETFATPKERQKRMDELLFEGYTLEETEDVAPFFQMFPNKDARAKKVADLKREGYAIEPLTLSAKPSEELFLDVKVVALNDILQNVIERMGKETDFSAFSLDATEETYTKKGGGTEPHLVIKGQKDGRFNKVMAEFGGYPEKNAEGKKTGRWRFPNPSETLEKQLLHALGTRSAELAAHQLFESSLLKHVADIVNSRASGSRRISRRGRKGLDVPVGYETDVLKAVIMSAKSVAGGVAKRIGARDMIAAFTGTDISFKAFLAEHQKELGALEDKERNKRTRELRKDYKKLVDERRIDSARQPRAYRAAKRFIQDMLRNESDVERAWKKFRGVVVLKYLGRAFAGVVNATNMVQNVPAALHGLANIPIKKIPGHIAWGIDAYARHFAYNQFGEFNAPEKLLRKGARLAGKPINRKPLTGETKWLFERMEDLGMIESQVNTESTAALRNSLGAAWAHFVDTMMVSFTLSEKMNRAATIAAAYRGLRAQHKGEWTMKDREATLLKAKEISDQAHGQYGKINLPDWARGPGYVAMAARSAYMFTTFSHNYIQLLMKLGLKNPADAAYMLIAPAVIAGSGASLLADPMLTTLVSTVAKLVPGLDEWEDDPLEALMDWIADNFGETAERYARGGASGGLFNVNLKGSLRIGITEIPGNVGDLVGAPYSFLKDFVVGGMDIAKGNRLKGLERAIPFRQIADPIKAYREFNEGLTTKGNQPLWYGDEPIRADVYDASIRALGGNPMRISEKRERQYNESEITAAYSKMRSDLKSRYARLKLTGQRGTEEWSALMIDIEHYNARVNRVQSGFAAERYRNVIEIDKTKMKEWDRELKRPPTTERRRAGTPAKKGWTKRPLDLVLRGQ